MDLRDLIINPGHGDYPEELRPYLPPLIRSLAVSIGRMVPSRSGGSVVPAEHFANEDNPVNWTPWGEFAAVAPVLSCGPQAGDPTRPAQGTAYNTPQSLWKLSGVAEGWSNPFKANPTQRPSVKMAIGRWTPFGSGGHPLPSNPAPGQMVKPGL